LINHDFKRHDSLSRQVYLLTDAQDEGVQ